MASLCKTSVQRPTISTRPVAPAPRFVSKRPNQLAVVRVANVNEATFSAEVLQVGMGRIGIHQAYVYWCKAICGIWFILHFRPTICCHRDVWFQTFRNCNVM